MESGRGQRSLLSRTPLTFGKWSTGLASPLLENRLEELEFSIDEKDVNAEIEESEGEEASDSDVDEELYVQLASSKSEEEVDDEVMCRPALVYRGGRGGRRWRGYGELFGI